MKTKLEQITTASELITYTLAFGVPTDPESICRMQDIIGHSTEEELEALADKYQEHDRTGKQFYFVLYHIWNWEDATRYFLQHSSLTVKGLEDSVEELSNDKVNLTKENDKLRTWHDNDTERIKDLNAQLAEAVKTVSDQDREADNLRQSIILKDQEIIELKAKLYDLMTR